MKPATGDAGLRGRETEPCALDRRVRDGGRAPLPGQRRMSKARSALERRPLARIRGALQRDGYPESGPDGHRSPFRLSRDWRTARFRDHRGPGARRGDSR